MPAPSDETLAFGEDAITALLGLDALYRAESADGDGLAVLNLDLDGRYAPERFASYAEARERFRELDDRAALLPEPDRRRYYAQLCGSSIAFTQWREEGLPFREQLASFLHVPVAPVADAELDGLRADMRALLDAMGYNGDLREQCRRWEERNRVPADEVEGVLAELMDTAWTHTEERLVEIPAPRSDAMRAVAVTGVPFNARCNYLERRVEINVEPVLTRPALKHLTAHEGCPGHYVQFKLRETWGRAGRAPADVLLSVVNTASSSVFEGIADAGLVMIDWMEGDDDRFQSLMTRYRAGIGTGAAWRLHALEWPRDEVRDWLAEQSLVGGEGWVDNRLAFIAAPSRAVLIWSYWWGEPSVLPTWSRVAARDRAAFVEWLHGRMHSVDTVAAFPGA
ncbi:MAG: hypothetical protein R3E98_01710 [Gemmatimonadota bacterium]|nr:hypothetical protein [Gemmatimonadota bacterium]